MIYYFYQSALHEVKRDYHSDSFFFNPHELTKIVQQKFYKISWSQIESFSLANLTKKVFPLFPRTIPYRERPKSPTFQFFFGIVRLFRKKSPKGSPFNFLMFCDRIDVEKSQRVPFSVFSALCDFFSEFFSPFFSPFIFLMFCNNGC